MRPRVGKPISEQDYVELLRALNLSGGNKAEAARLLGITRSAFRRGYNTGEALYRENPVRADFEAEPLPRDAVSLDDLIKARKKRFQIKEQARKARRLINVKINMTGPIGILHMGDPHVDDDGTDIEAIDRDLTLCETTEGLFAANVGDLHNNWVGRLSRLYGEQSTSAAEAWQLVEWMVTRVPWLYLLKGNHDLWSGSGDPLEWMRIPGGGVKEAHGARLNLQFPNGNEVRVNARHDFAGHSMWNTVHGATKAFKAGWQDHLLTCGHKHTSGYNILKDPASGLIGHAIRVAGYKRYDRYADELGLPDQNISPSVVTIINPDRSDDDPGMITTIWDAQEGADFLTWKRNRK